MFTPRAYVVKFNIAARQWLLWRPHEAVERVLICNNNNEAMVTIEIGLTSSTGLSIVGGYL